MSTLFYTLDHDTGRARWVTSDAPAGDDNASPSSVAADDPAAQWVARQVPPDSEWSELSDFLPCSSGGVRHAPAPVVDATPPVIRIVADRLVGAMHRVSLEIETTSDFFVLCPPADVSFKPLGVAGLAVATLRGRALGERPVVQHWGRPFGPVAVELELSPGRTTDNGVPIELVLVEHHQRLPNIPGVDLSRPESVAPRGNTLTDRAMFQTRIVIAAPTGS